MKGLRVSIFVIGDELLAGDIVDVNGPYLAEKLTDQGFRIQAIHLLPDDVNQIAGAVKDARRGCRLVVLCGGLGPTSDDRTTEAVARAFNRKLVLDKTHWERIRQAFSILRGEEPSPGNEKQATFPQGIHILANEIGMAPGYVLQEGGDVVAVLPGPPKENQPMFQKELLPWLNRNMPEREKWAVSVFRVFGLPESEVGYRLKSFEKENTGVRISYRFSFPEILVKLRCEARSGDCLASLSAELMQLLAPHVYSTNEERLPAVLGRELAGRGLRIVTAESCTGGLAAKLLTDTAGSSAWMERGFVTYTNAAKVELLNVPGELIEKHGAVSEEVARAMLAGALSRSDAHVGLAITGIAGPTGGTIDKPVGSVCIAWGDSKTQHTHTYWFHWDREFNRIISVWAGMHQLYQHISGA